MSTATSPAPGLAKAGETASGDRPPAAAEGQAFKRERRIRFSDCDPAGIVFYPQYFVMLNGLVEDWVDALGIGYQRLVIQRRVGLPTVRLEADFQAVSHFGDAVALTLQVVRLGGRSLTLQLRCEGAEGDTRMSARQVIVTTSLDSHRAIDIPNDLRDAIQHSGCIAAS